MLCPSIFSFFFFNDTATTEIYTLSLHDALPISRAFRPGHERTADDSPAGTRAPRGHAARRRPGTQSPARRRLHRHGCARQGEVERSEEHTSELQSHLNLVCRLLLEKKKTTKQKHLPSDLPSCALRQKQEGRNG